MKNTAEALRWIIQILVSLHIQFHISGGLAAIAYGSLREVADIDIDIPENDFDILAPCVKDYITYGPTQYKDTSWDLLLMTLEYKGQLIDICGAFQVRIVDHITKRWVYAKTTFKNDEQKELFGIKVPVMNRSELLDYKRKLGREVDLQDIKALTLIDN